jgi:hypothetical protein
MLRPGVRVARTFARAALLTGLMGLGSALACSLIVGDTPTTVFCTPDGGPSVCGPEQVCAPLPTGTEYSCVKSCPKNACRSDEMCDHAKGWCVPFNPSDVGVETGDAAPSETAVPEATDVVVAASDADAGFNDAQPQCMGFMGFGCACNGNMGCQSPYACVNAQAVTKDIWSAWADAGGSSDGGFCAKPCCTSLDCDMGDGGENASVCFATGAGGNYCVPLGFLADRASVGALGGGANCASAPGSACRSGLCLDAGVCADTCCSTGMMGANAQCSGMTGSMCLFGQFPGTGFDTHESANCGLPVPFTVTTGTPCSMNSDCRSNLCVDAGGTFMNPGSCQDPCRGSCTGGFLRATCQYLQPDPTVGAPDIVAACFPSGLRGDAGVTVCFVDSTGSTGDCQPGERCRPQPLTVEGMTYSVLACGN